MMLASTAVAQLPSIQLKDINGKTIDTKTLSNDGKPFVISFFATWCKPCNRELKAIHEVYPDWQDETGMKLYAVSIDRAQDVNKVKPMVDSEGWEYEVLLDTNKDLYRAFGKAMREMPPKWRILVLSSHTEFERTFGRPADKKRKLYNGMLKCDVFMYGNRV